MILLGIESATESVGVALAASDGVLASVEVARGRRHAESIVPCVQFVCERADIELSEVGAIAVDVGPGLFTGMRVGIATAKSLAMALNIPMVPMTSLEVLAAAEATTDDIIVPVVDARKSEVFWAMYRRPHQGLELLHQPTVGSVDVLVSDLMARDQSSVCVGDGAHRYGDDITAGFSCSIGAAVHPSASVLASEAVLRAIRDETVAEQMVEPVYLRQPDAQINWSTREVRS